jgi:ferredoxin-NADP reductase
VARVYSIANTPPEAASDGIEFHVRVYPDGAMSPWLAAAAPGTRLRIGQPRGDCCYLPGQPDGPLLLAGTGTGIAPLAAVLRDALRHGHAGPAVLIHGAADRSGLYLGTSRPDLQTSQPDIQTSQPDLRTSQPDPRTSQPDPRASQPDCGPPAPVRWRTCVQSAGADIAAVACEELARLGDPGAVRAYLCGGRRSVTRMRRALFLAGMSLKHICADEFTQASS